MSSSAMNLVQRQASVTALARCAKVFVMLPVAGAGSMTLLALVSGTASAAVGASIGGCIGIALAIYVCRGLWRDRHAEFAGQRAAIIRHWLSATSDPKEAAHRRRLYLEGGEAAVTPLISGAVVRDQQRVQLAKKALLRRSAGGVAVATAAGASPFGDETMGASGQAMLSGVTHNGLPAGVATWNDETESWATTGGYVPPTSET